MTLNHHVSVEYQGAGAVFAAVNAFSLAKSPQCPAPFFRRKKKSRLERKNMATTGTYMAYGFICLFMFYMVFHGKSGISDDLYALTHE